MELFSRDVGKVRILQLSGVLDRNNSHPIRQWIDVTTKMEPAYLVVNLAGVEFLDSNTLAILVHGLKRAHQNRGDLRLCCLRNSVRILFELTRLDNVFEIFVSEEDAIQSYKVVEKLSQPA